MSGCKAPGWLRIQAVATDEITGRTGIVQAVEDWEDPHTHKVIKDAVFLRPFGGGLEWVTTVGHVKPARTESDQ